MRWMHFILGAWLTKVYIAIKILFGEFLYEQKEFVARQRRAGTRFWRFIAALGGYNHFSVEQQA
jgi:hypothetical protein